MVAAPEATGARRAPHSSDRLRANLSRILFALFAGAGAIGASGCWLAAIQLAPLAVKAAAGVGSAVVNVAESAVIGAHQGSDNARDPNHTGESEVEREDRCAQLELEVPDVIEIRKSAAGTLEYRGLQLGGSLQQPQWMPIVEHDTNSAGWRPAVNLLQLNFTPPRADAFADAGSSYLAYAPIQSESGVPQDLAPMTLNFGAAVGTFKWNGSLYQFAMAHTLPCFPPPPPP